MHTQTPRFTLSQRILRAGLYNDQLKKIIERFHAAGKVHNYAYQQRLAKIIDRFKYKTEV